MINDLIGLLELLRHLIQRKAEIDKQYFEKFLQPTWEVFAKIHEDYKTSFRKYRQLVSEDNSARSKVLIDALHEMMRNDSIYSADMRSELEKLSKYLPARKAKGRRAYVLDYVSAIHNYFSIGSLLENYDESALRNIRWQIMKSISRNPRIGFADVKHIRKYLLELLEKNVGIVQESYAKVADCFYRMRKEFLS